MPLIFLPRQPVQIVVDFRLEAGDGNPEVFSVIVRPDRHIDGPDLHHGLIHHVEDSLGGVGDHSLPGGFLLFELGPVVFVS